MCFYERLRETRKQKNISQKEIAEKIGVAPSTYCQYEKGTREPDLIKLKLISKALNVSPDYLIFGENTQSEAKTPYEKLNDAGKAKADEYISDLSFNPKYRKEAEILHTPIARKIAAFGAKGTKGDIAIKPKKTT